MVFYISVGGKKGRKSKSQLKMRQVKSLAKEENDEQG
jgi:hypothetical protein